MPSYIDKYNIKREGLDLEKEDPEEAIKFYKDLLNDELFVNDYYPYRRLVLMYKKTKKYNRFKAWNLYDIRKQRATGKNWLSQYPNRKYRSIGKRAFIASNHKGRQHIQPPYIYNL